MHVLSSTTTTVLTTLIALLDHLPSASATPAPQSAFPASPVPFPLFHLRVFVPPTTTQPLPPYADSTNSTTKDCPVPVTAATSINNTYLSAYHTGAGLNDVILTPDVSIAAPGFLNGTALQFSLGGSGPGPNDVIPWVMELGYGQSYTSFGPVNINAGLGTPPGLIFYPNSTTIPPDGIWVNTAGTAADPLVNATTEENQFSGWIACEWWHQGLPQLFWTGSSLFSTSMASRVPFGCAEVVLLREDIADE